MRQLVLFFAIVLLFSCKKDNSINAKINFLTETNWVLDRSKICDNIIYYSGGDRYKFHADKTYTYFYNTYFYPKRDIGTWEINKNNELFLNYQTIYYDTSEMKHSVLTIYNISENEIVLELPYNDTTITGEYCAVELKFYEPK